ncbi:MAG: hypothetical protein M3Z50_00855 [Actinomycetota bacterium]|nr:hypothetical protein [Actinomycetota bacterium]
MTTAPLQDLVRQSPFVFRGTVLAAESSATTAVVASQATAVIRVLEVIRSPRAFSRLAGSDVTINLLQPGQPAPGVTVVFYARLHLAAETLALDEIDHQPLPSATAAVGGLSDAIAAQRDIRLNERLATASAVVVGTVSNVRRSVAASAEAEQSGFVSEHDPEWSEAVVAVDSVVKGAAAEAVVIVFPASIDVAWYRAPKFHPGQTGVFLLHDEGVPSAAAAQYDNVYTSLDVPDVLPIEEQSRVRALLANAQ